MGLIVGGIMYHPKWFLELINTTAKETSIWIKVDDDTYESSEFANTSPGKRQDFTQFKVYHTINIPYFYMRHFELDDIKALVNLDPSFSFNQTKNESEGYCLEIESPTKDLGDTDLERKLRVVDLLKQLNHTSDIMQRAVQYATKSLPISYKQALLLAEEDLKQ